MTDTVQARHLAIPELEAGLPGVRQAPKDRGTVELIARRPDPEQREVLDEARLDPLEGLVGDCWRARGSSGTPDGSADPEAQITLMNARMIDLVAGDCRRWALAGDQLYVDFDLSSENVPPGMRLAVGDAIVQVSEKPHTGCKKFAERFGTDAVRFLSTPLGRQLNLRGINTRIITAGTVRQGDTIHKV